MASDDTDDRAPSDSVREGINDLDSGTVIGDRVVLSKRHAALILGGGATLASVLGVGAGEATAQSSGKLGASDDPIDADLGNYGSTSTADGFEITIEGETFQFNE